MAKRRSGEVELCFDSMTDLITNLAGGLILVVLLLLGLTREASSQTEPPPPPPEKAKNDPAEKSIRPLKERINQLRLELQGVDNDIKNLDQRMPGIRQEVEELLKKVASIPPPKVAQDPPQAKKPEPVPFRKPLSRKSDKKTNVALVCAESRIGLFDFEAKNKAVNLQAMAQANAQQLLAGQTVRKTVTIPAGDFDLRVEIILLDRNTGTVSIMQEAVRKSGHPGETLAEFQDANSPIRKRLAALNASDNIVQFAVYPDSFETFRAARSVAWDLQFDVGWVPMKTGMPLRFGAGRATGQ